ncbi:DMT family transporter [Paenochrobactrum pullorum]|uniref:DMT family transporter n=1 Tax=Paenochrobactrum pullorum TaxID=1324351 RepID=UPI0035BBEF53
MSRLQANFLLLLAGMIWGMGFVAQSTAMASIGPFMFIAVRSVIASFSILPMAMAEGKRARKRLSRRDYFFFAAIGLVLFIGLAAQQIGLQTTSVTNAGFLTGLYLILVPVLGVLIFRAWPHGIIWPCSLAALAGIYLLSGGELSALKQGDWLVMFGAFFWALQVLLIGQANRTGRPITLSVVQFATCGVVGFIFAFALGEVDWSAVGATWKQLLFTGVFSSGVAFTLQAIGQRYTTPPQAAIFLSSEALFAALFGAIFLSERLSFAGLVGCALIFISMLAVEIIPMLVARRRPITLTP